MTADTLTDSPVFAQLLPAAIRRVLPAGPAPGTVTPLGSVPERGQLLELYRMLVLGRALEDAATTMAKQGLMAVYPAARGQEACQVGAAAALQSTDWLFPTYRDSIAVISRGADPAEVLAAPLGRRHLGYDPLLQRRSPATSPRCATVPSAVSACPW